MSHFAQRGCQSNHPSFPVGRSLGARPVGQKGLVCDMHRPVVFPERGHSWFAGVVAFHFLCFSSFLPVAQRLPFHVRSHLVGHITRLSGQRFWSVALHSCCVRCARLTSLVPFMQARLVKKVLCVTCIVPLSSLSTRPLLGRGRGCIPFLVFLVPSSGCSTPAVSCAVPLGWSYHPFVRLALLVRRVAPLLCAMSAIDLPVAPCKPDRPEYSSA